jgi:hypothetical protein
VGVSMKPRSIAAALAIIFGVMCSAFAAQAGLITIFVSGNGTGTLGATPFTNDPFTFELSGNDGNNDAGIALTTAEVFLTGFSSNPYSISGSSLINLNQSPQYAFLRPNTNNGGVSTGEDYAHIFLTPSDFSSLQGGGTGSVVAFPTGISFFNPIPTSGGTLTFNEAATGPFFLEASKVQNVSAVPELSTWAMMLIGFAGIGFASYRRSKRTMLASV